jgi:hypothetical protein
MRTNERFGTSGAAKNTRKKTNESCGLRRQSLELCGEVRNKEWN